MVLRAPFPLSSLPASIEHSMKLSCVCAASGVRRACGAPQTIRVARGTGPRGTGRSVRAHVRARQARAGYQLEDGAGHVPNQHCPVPLPPHPRSPAMSGSARRRRVWPTAPRPKRPCVCSDEPESQAGTGLE